MPVTESKGRGVRLVLLCAAIIYLGCILSPPGLMDDVDAVQAQISRNMLQSGDWVTARLDGVVYLEKSPLIYWMMATSMAIFGVHDWTARLPLALSVVLLCWLTTKFGAWAFGDRAGEASGLCLATSVGLFLFTRIQIPDAILTATITLALWSLARALEEDEPHPTRWAYVFWASLGTGLLLKGLIAVVFPVAAGGLYLFLAGRDWRRLRPFAGIWIAAAIAAPWHVIATLRNPPYFDFTMRSEPGHYRGFFWFYFFNEHILRFLNLRFPRDYNTVPRAYFWLFHLLWLFPWSPFLPAAARLQYRPVDRASRVRLLALCWTGFILVFFTFSTTQEYYSMPCYPALALLLGSAITSRDNWLRFGRLTIGAVSALAAVAIAAILWHVWSLPAPGDIASALRQNPDVYTLSLGHMTDLTLDSFAYLRPPLILAGVAFLVGSFAAFRWHDRRVQLGLVLMMVLFYHAARLALVTFDPYLGSRPLAEAIQQAPPGKLIVDDQYYAFSSIFWYSDRTALLLNGRVNNLEYGSNAPGAPDVFLNDSQFAQLWASGDRYYVVLAKPALERIQKLSAGKFHLVRASGGKAVYTNQPL